ncbi:hypothetical protein HIM_00412 [Hirsutella minnesotensis 3608]|nr:hypothetical protein HIM_00412 [Hirsutella minnesotensis 3608]
MDITPDDDDPRSVELETLTAIYPEIRQLSTYGDAQADEAAQSPSHPFVFEIELPVQPAEPVTVVFPVASPAQQDVSDPTRIAPSEPIDSLLVSHLPPLCLHLALPDGYPDQKPLKATVTTSPQWLSRKTLASLEDVGPRLWEEAGRDLVAYAYIDHVQRAAEDVFGAISPEGTLEINAAHKLAVLDYDIKAKRAAFEKETFDCGVCLDPKKGSACHKMADCGHIFCLQCLRDFYGDAIEQGNLPSVRCLTPNCAKERAAALSATGNASRPAHKPKTFISPSELLQIGLSADLVKRYVTLKYKTELESDKDTVYCPRQWCNGAARSKKHKKPEGLEFGEASDADESAKEEDEQEQEQDETAANGAEAAAPAEAGAARKQSKSTRFNPADLLCVCEDCGFAFCSRCLQTWHGEFVRCAPRRNKDELTEEEQASLEYMQLHTSPCPTCNAPAQKTHGCNHMVCSRCDTHFCYLCSSWLDPANPYKHYNQQSDGKVTSCYMRLWELEGGDGDDVGLGYAGGRAPAAAAAEPRIPRAEEPEAVWDQELSDDDDDSEGSDDEVGQGNGPQARPRGQGVAVAREAPLVLRLVDNNPQRRNERAEQDRNVAARGDRGGRGRGRGRGQNARHPRGGAEAPRVVGARDRGRGQIRGAAGAGRAARGARVARGGVQGEQGGAHVIDHVNEHEAAWVRRFVQLALVDAEDMVDEDMEGLWPRLED